MDITSFLWKILKHCLWFVLIVLLFLFFFGYTNFDWNFSGYIQELNQRDRKEAVKDVDLLVPWSWWKVFIWNITGSVDESSADTVENIVISWTWLVLSGVELTGVDSEIVWNVDVIEDDFDSYFGDDVDFETEDLLDVDMEDDFGFNIIAVETGEEDINVVWEEIEEENYKKIKLLELLNKRKTD